MSIDNTGESPFNIEPTLDPTFNISQTPTNDTVSGNGSFIEDLYLGFSGYSDTIIFSLIVITGAITLYFIIHYFLSRAATSLDLKDRKVKGINSIMKMIIIVITITIILFQFSSISGAAAGAISVVVGTIIGFSSRNTISNAIAGIILLSARPFKIGDRISTTDDDSLLGDVVEITLIYTKIKTIKNELVTIPNQSLLQNQIVNYSGFQYLAVAVEIGVGYEEDKEKVKSLLIESASSTPGIISDNPKPYVILKRFENFAAIFELRAYTNRSNEFLRIQSDIREKIYELFQLRGIDLSTPYSVHLNQFQDITKEFSRKNNKF